ncbi:MAG: CCA tRNA nucleotidyltransferase [Pseudoramibacter sp.]
MTKNFLETWPFDVLFETFRNNGEALYLVGGAVRDLLLGRKPGDWDLTTSAKPDKTVCLLAKAFPGHRPILKGRRFGTIGIDVSDQYRNLSFEITTFRTEDGYKDRRHPEKVRFQASILEDVRRRDFTVNGLWMDAKGVIYDAVGGFSDLEKRQVRCIGDADRRLAEDPLRKWRGVRFAAQIGGTMAPETRAAIRRAPETEGVSFERLREEWIKMLLNPNAAFALKELTALGLWDDLLGRLNTPEIGTLSKKLCESVEALPFNLEMRLAWLLQEAPEESRRAFLKGLRFSKKEIQRVETLMIFKRIDCENIVAFKTLLRESGLPVFEQALTLQTLKNPGNQNNRRCLENIISHNEPILYQDLAVEAGDLMALGFRGKALGEALNQLCRLVYAHPEVNSKDQMLKAAAKLKNEEKV